MPYARHYNLNKFVNAPAVTVVLQLLYIIHINAQCDTQMVVVPHGRHHWHHQLYWQLTLSIGCNERIIKGRTSCRFLNFKTFLSFGIPVLRSLSRKPLLLLNEKLWKRNYEKLWRKDEYNC